MNIDQLLEWAEQHNYPQFIVDENDIVRPGRYEWEKLRYDKTGRATLIIERLEAFLARCKPSLRIVKDAK
jgi:hypothetical protein